MHRHPACPTDEFLWTIAAARLLLPADIHLQAPPNLSDELGPLVAAGIDDWGGVSPVTADHVNPERAWPALGILRAATEAAGHVLAPRLTLYPEFALDPDRWLDPRPAVPRARRLRRRGAGPGPPLDLGRRGRPRPSCSPRSSPPTAAVPTRGRHPRLHRRRGGRGARRACWPAGRWTRTRS